METVGPEEDAYMCGPFHRDRDNDSLHPPSTHHRSPSVICCQLNSTFVPRLSGSAFLSFQSHSRSFPDSLYSLCQPYGWIEAHLCKHQVDPVSAVAFWTQLLVFIFLGRFSWGSSAWRRGFPPLPLSNVFVLFPLPFFCSDCSSLSWLLWRIHHLRWVCRSTLREDVWGFLMLVFFWFEKDLLLDDCFSFVLDVDGREPGSPDQTKYWSENEDSGVGIKRSAVLRDFSFL